MRRKLVALVCLLSPALVCGAEDAYHVVPLKPGPAFALDAHLTDWGEVPNPLLIERPEQVHVGNDKCRGPEDLSARAQLAWRTEGLYIAVEVGDDRLDQSQRPSMIYKGDHIKVFFDVRPDVDTARTTWGEGQLQFVLRARPLHRATGWRIFACWPPTSAGIPVSLGALLALPARLRRRLASQR